MNKLQDKKQIKLMMFLFSVMYFTSYISRINFGAIMEGMIETEGFLKESISLAPTVAFITYGVGQLISGVLGDKFNPKYLMFFGLLLTATMNSFIPFCPNPSQMVWVWGVNGFAQAFMWPPLVKIMTMLFDSETYRVATVRVSWGSSIGTIAVYVIASVCSSTVGWRGVFFVSAGACVIMAAIWLLALKNTDTSIKTHTVKKIEENSSKQTSPFTIVAIVAIVIGIISQGALRDGITTWLPTFVNDTFNLGSAISILTGVILPLFSIACFNITLKLLNTKVKNELLLSAYIFLVGTVSAVLLYFCHSWNAVITVFLMALLAGSMHGVNLILVCMMPSYFKNASTASGTLNAFTYVGSAISTYGIAFLSGAFGWGTTIGVWIGVAVIGTIACFIAKTFRNPKEKK